MRDLLVRSYIWILFAVAIGMFAADAILERQYTELENQGDFTQADDLFRFVNDNLSHTAFDEWPYLLEELGPHFPYLIELSHVREEEELSTEQRQQLASGDSVLLVDDDIPYKIYPLDDGQILIFYSENPEYEPLISYEGLEEGNFELILSLLPTLFVAIAVFFILRPIASHIQRLSGVVEAFGQGNMTVRANEGAPVPIRDLSRVFNTMASRIDNLIKERDVITGAMSHELKTPLARLRFALDLSKSEDSKEVGQQLLQNMDQDIDELEDLIQEMLTYTRLSHASILENIAVFEPQALLQRAVEDLVTLSPHLELTHHCQITQSIPGSLKDLIHALRNIVSNAQRYASSKIEVQAKIEGQEVVLVVEDDGPGIPIEQRDYVLMPFARLDSSRTRKTGGCGLGLSIADQVLKGHSGHVAVAESQWGGARFELRWPLEIKNQSVMKQ